MINIGKIERIAKNFRVNFSIQILTAGLVLLAVLRNAWKGHLFGDDWPNSMVSSWVLWINGLSGFDAFISQVFIWTRGWAEGQGRFFPFAVITTRASFIFLTIDQYRWIKFFILLGFVVLISYFFAIFVGQKYLFPIALVASASTIQFRHDFDPYLGFTMLLPLSVSYIFLAALILRKNLLEKNQKKFIGRIAFSSLLFFMGLTTYEYSIFVIPVAIYFITRDINLIEMKRTLIFNSISLLPTLYTVLHTFFVLRPNRENKIPSYEITVNFENNLQAVVSQISASIPASQVLFGIEDYPHLGDKTRFVILFSSILFILTLSVLSLGKQTISKKSAFQISLISLYLIIAPAILVSMTSRWQGENLLRLGHAYLPILIQNIGVAWFLALILVLGRNSLANLIVLKFKKISINYVSIVIFTIAVPAYVLTMLIPINQNKLINGNFQVERMEIIKAALKPGFSNILKNGDRLISWEQNDAFEINRAIFSQYSATDLSSLNHPLELWSRECLDDESCILASQINELINSQEILISNSKYNPDISMWRNFYLNEPPLKRQKVARKSNVYYLDATFYQGGIVLALSPIIIDENQVKIDRRNIFVRWYRVGENINPPGKLFSEDFCVLPNFSQDEINIHDTFLTDLPKENLISLRNTPVGHLC